MSHTPGPWYVGYEDGSGRGEEGDYIAITTDASRSESIADDVADHRGVRRLADAYLIAAAPDLRDACQAALQRIEDPWVLFAGKGKTIDELRAALRRAQQGRGGAGLADPERDVAELRAQVVSAAYERERAKTDCNRSDAARQELAAELAALRAQVADLVAALRTVEADLAANVNPQAILRWLRERLKRHAPVREAKALRDPGEMGAPSKARLRAEHAWKNPPEPGREAKA